MIVKWAGVEVGDNLPPLTAGPITRTTLALYAGGSGDHTPYHIDTDYAHRAGYDDVFAHGMLSMAYLGRLLTQWVDQRQIRAFNARFLALTHVHDEIMCSGQVVEKIREAGEGRVRLTLAATTKAGVQTLSGTAEVALPD
ncbi:MAG: (3R)-hydroxyacyl-ACP dehydratase subunit HadB [Sphingomonadales bacterium]